MSGKNIVLLMVGIVVAACEQNTDLQLPGSTEWDRIVIPAEVSERVVDWVVAEGQRVDAGDLILHLESSRFDTRISAARHRLAEAEAGLAELRSGPRIETIDRSRAELESAQAAAVEAGLEYERLAELQRRGLTSDSSVDQAIAALDQRRAAVAAAEAALNELLAGTRSEQLDQAEAKVAALRAELGELLLTRERLDVRAPRAGRVDALPFKPGDQPRVGDSLASLLVGAAPIARIFIPASVRAQFSEGDAFDVKIEGVDTVFNATLRSIRSEASFTPYYALTGDDASRLVYRAELLFEDAESIELPAGLPLIATPRRSVAGD